MTEDTDNLILERLRRLNDKIDVELGGLRTDVKAVLNRMTSIERGLLALDGAIFAKQDQIDGLRHRIEHLERAVGTSYRVPEPEPGH